MVAAARRYETQLFPRIPGSSKIETAIEIKIPITATIPKLASASFEAKASDPKPIAVEVPQNSTAFPVPFHTALKSPPVRLTASRMWIV